MKPLKTLGFCSDGTCKCRPYLPNLTSVALPVPEIIGVTPEIGESLDTPTVPFSKVFNGLLRGWTLRMFCPSLKFVASPVPEIVIAVLGGCFKPSVVGKKRR